MGTKDNIYQDIMIQRLPFMLQSQQLVVLVEL